MGNGMPDVSGNPVAVYAAMAVVLVLAVGTITDKGLGPLSRWFFDFARRRRVAAAEKRAQAESITDASYERDLGTLQQQVDRLESTVSDLREEMAARDTLVVEHMRWDRRARLIAVNCEDTTLGEPPPLIPTD